MLRKYLTSAFLGVKSARLRSFLTVLGIAMGIFLVITLIAVGKGAQKDVVSRITDLGADIVTVQSVNTELTKNQSSSPVSLINNLGVATLTLDDLATVQKQQHVTKVAPLRYIAGQLKYEGKSAEPAITIITTRSYSSFRKLDFSAGKLFSNPNDQEMPEVIIGNSLKQRLFGDSEAVGRSVTFNDQKVRVSGVLTADQAGGQSDNTLIGPTSLVTDPAQASFYSQILAEVDDVSNVTPVIASIKSTISSYRQPATFMVTSSQELLSASNNVLKVLTALISVLAFISLTMSGVGIMNMMVVAVTDRTKEIGVRKTVGASAINIFWQFLLEAVLLTVLGGVIGLGMTMATVFAISKLLPIQPMLSPQLVVLGLGLSILVGVLFGVGPAMRAAQKEPIEALQTDRS